MNGPSEKPRAVQQVIHHGDKVKSTGHSMGKLKALSISVAAAIGATSAMHVFFEILSAVLR